MEKARVPPTQASRRAETAKLSGFRTGPGGEFMGCRTRDEPQ
jgi:hypothetical protein